jgi:hypothetical protein
MRPEGKEKRYYDYDDKGRKHVIITEGHVSRLGLPESNVTNIFSKELLSPVSICKHIAFLKFSLLLDTFL